MIMYPLSDVPDIYYMFSPNRYVLVNLHLLSVCLAIDEYTCFRRAYIHGSKLLYILNPSSTFFILLQETKISLVFRHRPRHPPPHHRRRESPLSDRTRAGARGRTTRCPCARLHSAAGRGNNWLLPVVRTSAYDRRGRDRVEYTLYGHSVVVSDGLRSSTRTSGRGTYVLTRSPVSKSSRGRVVSASSTPWSATRTWCDDCSTSTRFGAAVAQHGQAQ